MLPDFNRLKIFYYIYAKGSIVGAAAKLNITQSAISQHLQKLEQEIKTQLFTRQHKRLIPTSAGTKLFSIVEPFIEQLFLGLDAIQLERVVPSGRLRIGAPMEFGKTYFPKLFAEFRKKYPDVSFMLKLGDAEFILSLLNRGELDFGFVDLFLAQHPGSKTAGIYSFDPLLEEEIILACSSTYYQNRINGNHSFDHLIKQDFVAYRPKTSTLRSWFKHHFDKTAVKIQPVMMVDSVQAILSGIKHHMGLGLTISHFVQQELKKGVIIPITTEKEPVINKISLVQLQDKVPSLTEKTFQAFLKEQITRLDLETLVFSSAVGKK